MARILIADDSAVSRTVLRNLLSEDGHEVVGEASNGTEAVEFYAKLKPDLVTLDVTMPGKNGINALREIIEIDPNARIVMVTALGQNSIMLDALKNGARDYVTKPFEKEKILPALASALGDRTGGPAAGVGFAGKVV